MTLGNSLFWFGLDSCQFARWASSSTREDAIPITHFSHLGTKNLVTTSALLPNFDGLRLKTDPIRQFGC